jgi:hypothetical protein
MRVYPLVVIALSYAACFIGYGKPYRPPRESDFELRLKKTPAGGGAPTSDAKHRLALFLAQSYRVDC